MRTQATRTRMVPNSGALQAYAADAGYTIVKEAPVPRPDEPNVYNLPTDLHPIYRSLPLVVRLGLGFASIWAAAISTFEGHTRKVGMRKILALILKAGVYFFLSNVVLQEVFTSPSRITTQDLMDRYFLPSRLSQYESVHLADRNSLGVHFLKYERSTGTSDHAAIYLNHGFGASSLSWLPVIPKLSERLRIRKTLAHDAVGFGFTDRPKDLSMYTPLGSSEIGLQVLKKNVKNATSIILMGHSMGSLATLEMAVKLPEDIAVTVILVAPALGLLPAVRKESTGTSPLGNLVAAIVSPPSRYILRRVVGVGGFWKAGLKSAWGNPKLVTDSDALRFQWPSIGKGWEQGLLQFTNAMRGFSDGDILQQVMNRSNIKTVVILGEKDPVIQRKVIDKVFEPYPDIQIVEVAGCGHDAFEENVDGFLDAVEKALGTSSPQVFQEKR